MNLILKMFINFKQIIFRGFFSWIINQNFVWLFDSNFRLIFCYLLNFCVLNRLIVNFYKILCKLKYFIIRFHIKVGQHNLCFIYDAVLLNFYIFNDIFTLNYYVFFFFCLINKQQLKFFLEWSFFDDLKFLKWEFLPFFILLH